LKAFIRGAKIDGQYRRRRDGARVPASWLEMTVIADTDDDQQGRTPGATALIGGSAGDGFDGPQSSSANRRTRSEDPALTMLQTKNAN
jgi:hypothetical protein